MNPSSSIVYITRSTNGVYNSRVNQYIEKGYKIETVYELERFDNGSVAVRLKMVLDASPQRAAEHSSPSFTI